MAVSTNPEAAALGAEGATAHTLVSPREYSSPDLTMSDYTGPSLLDIAGAAMGIRDGGAAHRSAQVLCDLQSRAA